MTCKFGGCCDKGHPNPTLAGFSAVDATWSDYALNDITAEGALIYIVGYYCDGIWSAYAKDIAPGYSVFGQCCASSITRSPGSEALYISALEHNSTRWTHGSLTVFGASLTGLSGHGHLIPG